MSVREIWQYEVGIDVGECWEDGALIERVNQTLSLHLHAAYAYCLALHVTHTGEAWFEPAGGTGYPTVSSLKLPERIPLDDLLVGPLQWPPIAIRYGPNIRSEHPGNEVPNWQLQLRLERGIEYVGYAIAAGFKLPSNVDIWNAVDGVRRLIKNALSERRRKFALHRLQWQHALGVTRHEIDVELHRGSTRTAVQRVATLLTSHLGAEFNRCACLAPVTDSYLKSIYAHGGDCSADWATAVQQGVAKDINTIEGLQAQATRHSPPLDDPLYRELVVDDPLIIRLEEPSVPAEAWSACLTGNRFLRTRSSIPLMPYGEESSTWAIEVHSNQKWLRRRLSSPLMHSKNGSFFLLPWISEEGPLALWLLDLGYWGTIDVLRDVVPRLELAVNLLDSVSEQFAANGLARPFRRSIDSVMLQPGIADPVERLDAHTSPSGWQILESDRSMSIESLQKHFDHEYALQQLEQTGFAECAGDYVAVYRKQVVYDGPSEEDVRREAAKRCQVPPELIVVEYKGPLK